MNLNDLPPVVLSKVHLEDFLKLFHRNAAAAYAIGDQDWAEYAEFFDPRRDPAWTFIKENPVERTLPIPFDPGKAVYGRLRLPNLTLLVPNKMDARLIWVSPQTDKAPTWVPWTSDSSLPLDLRIVDHQIERYLSS